MIYSRVLSGQSVSEQFRLEQNQFPLAIECPSLNPASEVRLQFAQASGGQFYTLYKSDGSGVPHAVMSGAGPGWGLLSDPVTSWARVSLVGSQSDLRSFGMHPVR